MKKICKILVLGIIIVAFVIGLLLYFKPLALSDLISENQEIVITHEEFGVKDGEPYINYKNYDDITDEQKKRVISLFGEHSYKRTFGTVVSDGSLTGLGNDVVYIFVYDGSELVNTISISDTGSISANDKVYMLQDAPELINNLLRIVSN